MKKVGILGGGQLGLMLGESLARLGAFVAVYDPDPSAPARRIAHSFSCASFSDLAQLEKFVGEQDVVTYEFEAINCECLKRASRAANTKVVPEPQVLETTRSRLAERRLISSLALPCAPYAAVLAHKPSGAPKTFEEFQSGFKEGLALLDYPVVVKTDRGGYDGKGQWVLHKAEDLEFFFADIKEKFHKNLATCGLANFDFLVEKRINLIAEYSCIVLRTLREATLPHEQISTPSENPSPHLVNCFPVFENEHSDQILVRTRLPARIDEQVANAAKKMAEQCAEALDLEGLLTTEFFYGTVDNSKPQLLINEFAPRPHNSGHVTRRATNISQFDALALCLLDLPIPHIELLELSKKKHFVMQNVLGQHYKTTPGKQSYIQTQTARPELLEYFDYGKIEIRNGRKMGHLIYTET